MGTFMKNQDRLLKLNELYFDASINSDELIELKYLASLENEESVSGQILDFCVAERNEKLAGSDFNENLLLKIQESEKTGSYKNKIFSFNIYKGINKYFSVAAVILIVFCSALWLTDSFNNRGKGLVITNQNIIQNKDAAFNETKKAFELIESKLELAQKQLEKLDYASKGLEHLKYLTNINHKNVKEYHL